MYTFIIYQFIYLTIYVSIYDVHLILVELINGSYKDIWWQSTRNIFRSPNFCSPVFSEPPSVWPFLNHKKPIDINWMQMHAAEAVSRQSPRLLTSTTGCSLNIVFFSEDFKNIPNSDLSLFSLLVSVCTHTRQRCSITDRVQKNNNI